MRGSANRRGKKIGTEKEKKRRKKEERRGILFSSLSSIRESLTGSSEIV
jgi:hypothetical protein